MADKACKLRSDQSQKLLKPAGDPDWPRCFVRIGGRLVVKRRLPDLLRPFGFGLDRLFLVIGRRNAEALLAFAASINARFWPPHSLT